MAKCSKLKVCITARPFNIAPVLSCIVLSAAFIYGFSFSKVIQQSPLAFCCTHLPCLHVSARISRGRTPQRRRKRLLGGRWFTRGRFASPTPGLRSKFSCHLPKHRWCAQDFYVPSIFHFLCPFQQRRQKSDTDEARQITFQTQMPQFRIYYKTQSNKNTVGETSRSQK